MVVGYHHFRKHPYAQVKLGNHEVPQSWSLTWFFFGGLGPGGLGSTPGYPYA